MADDDAQKGSSHAGASKNPLQTNVALFFGALVLLGGGMMVYMKTQGGPTPQPPAAESMVGCLDRVLNTKTTSKQYDSAKLASELTELAQGKLDLGKSLEVSSIRENDKAVLDHAINACQSAYAGADFGTGLFRFNVETLRDGQPQGGVEVFHNVGDRSRCTTDSQGSCPLTIKAKLTDDITLHAEGSGFTGEVHVGAAALRASRPIPIALKRDERSFVIRVDNLDQTGEADLEVDPTWAGREGVLRSRQCAEHNQAPSPECYKAETDHHAAEYRVGGGTLKALKVRATFGGTTRERVLEDKELSGTFIPFDWKGGGGSSNAHGGSASASAASHAKPSCAGTEAKVALQALVRRQQWSNPGSLSATVLSDGRLTRVNAPENAGALEGRRVPVPSSGCEPGTLRAHFEASLSQ